jgi:hypothetical protein
MLTLKDTIFHHAFRAPKIMFNRLINRYFVLAMSCAITGAAILIWFRRTNFYYDHFFHVGSAVTRYQAARLGFACFLAWLIYATGVGVAVLLTGRGALRVLPAWERAPLFFILGAGLLHIVLFCLGLAGLYTPPVAIVLVSAITVASVPHLANCLRGAIDSLHEITRHPLKMRTIGTMFAVLATAVSAATFLAVKGLYPAGGHDYYNHYFHFYRKVVDSGSILPNEVWYHFYYSKGAGLYFLSMLLTDPLAPQLAASLFIACGAGIVWALLKRAGANGLIPWIGACLYIALLIYTPGPDDNRRHGGWGDLEKLHELTGVLCLSVVWIAYRLAHEDRRTLQVWGIALQLAIISLALLTPALVLLMGGFLFSYFIYLFIRQFRPAAAWIFSGCVTGGLSLMAIGLINYYLTGIPSDQLIVQLWPYLNLQKVSEWGVLFEVIMHHLGLVGLQNQSSPWSWAILPLLATYLRLELWWPILFAALPLVAFHLGTGSGRTALVGRFDARLWVALALFVLMVMLAALFGGGRSQDISFYRLSTFSYGPVLCAALCLWYLGLEIREFRKRWLEAGVAVVLAIAIPVWIAVSTISMQNVLGHYGNVVAIVFNAKRLFTGAYSLKDAYQNQQGWPGRSAWGGIYPGVITPWRMLPPKTPVWSFHIHSYCMLPDCEMRSLVSFRFSPSWQTVLFGPADEAKRKLQEERLNYFFFSDKLPISDLVMASPLFSPDHIADHLGIKWTDGTNYLLTWKEADSEELPLQMLDSYRTIVNASPQYQAFLAVNWKAIADYTVAHSKALQPFNLPWCTKCLGMLPNYARP